MGEPMLTQEQANKIKQLAFSCIEGVANHVSKPTLLSRIALERTKQEFDDYLKEITRE